MNKKLIQSYVGDYFISTIDRDYATMEANLRGSETLIQKKVSDKWVCVDIEGGGLEGDIDNHIKICRQIFEDGFYKGEKNHVN